MNSFGSATLALICSLGIITCPATAQTLPDYLPTDGLVAWYPFNGNADDESGNGNDGVVNGAMLTEDRDGNPNAAYSFDGVDDIISSGGIDEISGAQQLSVSIWFNAASMIGFDRLIGQEDDCSNVDEGFAFAFGNSETQNLRILLRNGSNTSCSLPSSLIPIGVWNHILVTYDGSGVSDQEKCQVYLNGQIQELSYFGTLPANLDVSNANTPFQIGASSCNQSGLSYFFEGFIDDIAIYNRALTPEEVTALYYGTSDFPGCTYADACNYDSGATVDDGTCIYPAPNYDCAGNCLLDLNNNGLCDLEEVLGCTNMDALNYNSEATFDDGSCMVTCKGDFDNDGEIGIPDLLGFLASFGNQCDGAGCMDPSGCNYDPNATFDLGYCEYPAEFFNCDGTPVNDADGDGVPDELEVAGCTDPTADNYDESATEDDGSCSYLSGLQIGDTYEGGLVAYIYQAGDPGFVEGEVHGFVVTDFNLANNIAWGCSGTFMETSSVLGSGMANTIQIVNSCDDPSFAAKLCYDLSHNGYSDWWLPSRDELQKIYNSRVILGIASSVHYWSSTDCSDVRARVLNFANGGWFNCSSHTTNRKVLSPYSNGSTAVRRVRAVRYF